MDWREPFEPGPIPLWLEAFDDDAAQAVEDLLWQRFHHGPHEAGQPQRLVAEWASVMPERFLEVLDHELATWIEKHWFSFPDDVPPARLADAWSMLADLVAWLELDAAPRALRRRLDKAPEYLGRLSTSASRDPLGRFYGAVAAHQNDRSLAPFWKRLGELPDDVPTYHARYALEGLRGLPAPEGELETGYRPESVRVLARLARAFKRRSSRDSEYASRADFLALARLHLRSLPLPKQWKRDLKSQLGPQDRSSWLLELSPDLKSSLIRPRGLVGRSRPAQRG